MLTEGSDAKQWRGLMSEQELMDWFSKLTQEQQDMILFFFMLMTEPKLLRKEAIKHVGESDVLNPGGVSTEPV